MLSVPAGEGDLRSITDTERFLSFIAEISSGQLLFLKCQTPSKTLSPIKRQEDKGGKNKENVFSE